MKTDLKLSPFLAITPLINIVLLARDLFLDQASAVLAMVVVLSTLLYAFAALATAARIFGAEGVLYSEQGNWADLFRRPAQPQRTASINGAFFCLALMFPSYFLLSALVAQWESAPIEWRVGFMVFGTVLIFGAFPLIFAAQGRVAPASGFQLHKAPFAAFIAAVLLGLSLWPFVLEILLALRRLNLASFGPVYEQKIQALVAGWRQLPAVVIIVAYAVVPAVFEELFFRGYLFSALRAHTRPAMVIFGSAVLFGLFHVVFSFNRFLPSTLLGVVLGWLCWRTRSVFPGMFLHACHNAFLVAVAYYQDEITRLGWFIPDKTGLPLAWLLAGTLGASVGAVLLYFAGSAGQDEVWVEIEEMA
jgi:ABC-2 type transport system permease protein/sodium transport system permease protein